jgi:protein-S-isoprenylcysteine O-methyltransferase Ste14
MPSAKYFIIACWAIFILVWLAAAAFAKPTARRETWRTGLKYRLPTLAGVLLIAKLVRVDPLTRIIVPPVLGIDAAGCLLCLAGLALAIWARATLGGNWSSMVTLKERHELIESGPYRLVRHPIYTAILTMLVGTALVVGTLSAVVSLPIFFAAFLIKLREEEALMMRQFPEAYAAYRQRAAALVPFVL